MKALHPTTLKLYENHCGHAVQLWAQQAPYSRDVFHTGVVAHAVLEEVGKVVNEQPELSDAQIQEVADAVVNELATTGRAYDKEPEPPIPLIKCIEGRNIALNWIRNKGLNPDASFEEHFAFDQHWNDVPYYDKSAVFRTMIDVVELHEEFDEDSGAIKIATVTDYKSSWRTSADDLDNLQRRAQALVVYLRHQPDILVMQVANLRTGYIHSRRINTYDEQQLLNAWKQDISQAIQVILADPKPAPGLNCIGCPYTPVCSHRHSYAAHGNDIVLRYAAALALVKELEPVIKKKCDKGSMTVPQGKIGYVPKEQKSALKTAPSLAYEAWVEQGGDAEGFIAMLSTPVTTLGKIAKKLYPGKEERDAFLDTVTQTKTVSRFGIQK